MTATPSSSARACRSVTRDRLDGLLVGPAGVRALTVRDWEGRYRVRGRLWEFHAGKRRGWIRCRTNPSYDAVALGEGVGRWAVEAGLPHVPVRGAVAFPLKRSRIAARGAGGRDRDVRQRAVVGQCHRSGATARSSRPAPAFWRPCSMRPKHPPGTRTDRARARLGLRRSLSADHRRFAATPRRCARRARRPAARPAAHRRPPGGSAHAHGRWRPPRRSAPAPGIGWT